jgi:hypothetical protein
LGGLAFGSTSRFVIAAADGEHGHAPERRQSPLGSESGFVIAAPNGKHDHTPGRRLPSGSESGFVITTTDSEDDHASGRRQSPLGSEGGFVIAAKDGEHDITQGIADLIQAPKPEEKHIASHVPRWVVWLAADLSESKAWALYHERLGRFASLIGDWMPCPGGPATGLQFSGRVSRGLERLGSGYAFFYLLQASLIA